MHDLQFVTGRDKLTAVPKGGGWLQGQGINRGGYGKNQPSDHIVDFLIVHYDQLWPENRHKYLESGYICPSVGSCDPILWPMV